MLCISFYSCSPENSLKENPDPFLRAFLHSNVKYLVRYLDEFTHQYDTLFFDKKGNKIAEKEFGSEGRYSYNDFNYLTRYYVKADFIDNYVIHYKKKDDTLFQIWKPLKHNKWAFMDHEIDSNKINIVKFKLDKSGKIISAVNSAGKTITKYKYKQDQMILKQIYSTSDNKLIEEWIYTYYEKDLIKTISLLSKEKLLMTHYFSSQGKIDSTSHEEYTEKYKYYYY